jgi:hypothetical protein
MRLTLAVLFAGLLAAQDRSSATRGDPFAVFHPTVVVGAADRERLDRGDVIVRVLPSESGEIAIFAAVRVDADEPRLASWVAEIAQLLKSPLVPEIARFSAPPRLEDLDSFELDDDDLNEIRRCQPADCGLKLNASEVALLRAGIGPGRSNWRSAAQTAFRRLILKRVQAYLEGGLAALRPYADHGGSPAVSDAFSSIVRHSVYLGEHLPALADYLVRYPQGTLQDADSFVYWSKERLAGRTIVTATHVSILRPGDESLPDVIVAGKQVFATRYMSGLLNITTIVRGAPGQHYLVYVNRSRVDVLDRWFGGVARMVIERRVKGDASDALRGLRRRLESGPPAAAIGSDGRD